MTMQRMRNVFYVLAVCQTSKDTRISDKHCAGDQTTTTLLEHSRASIAGSLCCVYNNVSCNFVGIIQLLCMCCATFLIICLSVYSVCSDARACSRSREDAPFYH